MDPSSTHCGSANTIEDVLDASPQQKIEDIRRGSRVPDQLLSHKSRLESLAPQPITSHQPNPPATPINERHTTAGGPRQWKDRSIDDNRKCILFTLPPIFHGSFPARSHDIWAPLCSSYLAFFLARLRCSVKEGLDFCCCWCTSPLSQGHVAFSVSLTKQTRNTVHRVHRSRSFLFVFARCSVSPCWK